MKNVRWLVVIIAILVASIASLAYDAPPGSAADNACNTGGVWEGKCDWPTQEENDWAWTCGWYIARYISHGLPASGVPTWCGYVSQQPANSGGTPVGPTPSAPPTCYDSGMPTWSDFTLKGPLNTLQNVDFYISRDGTCTGNVNPTSAQQYFIIEVTTANPTLVETDNACKAIAANAQVYINLANVQYPVPQSWYLCLISS